MLPQPLRDLWCLAHFVTAQQNSLTGHTQECLGSVKGCADGRRRAVWRLAVQITALWVQSLCGAGAKGPSPPLPAPACDLS